MPQALPRSALGGPEFEFRIFSSGSVAPAIVSSGGPGGADVNSQGRLPPLDFAPAGPGTPPLSSESRGARRPWLLTFAPPVLLMDRASRKTGAPE